MQHSVDDNLSLGVSQLLDNLHRQGLRWLPSGKSQQVTEWMAEHGSSIKIADAVVPPLPNALAESIASESLSQVPGKLEKPPITSGVQALELNREPIATVGAWQTALMEEALRVKLLSEEAASVSACQRCSQLVCSRTKTVYGVGNAMTSIVFVGEGPGAEEDRTGVPFVGAAGQLLDKIITAMNLTRDGVYIMNAVKCRPQNNRTPTDEEIANCQPYFIKQLETIQPKFIVCLGAVASRAVLQTTLGIGKLRGRFHSFRGAQVAVTYHPAYLLRTPEAKRLTWEDMKMVMAAMKP